MWRFVSFCCVVLLVNACSMAESNFVANGDGAGCRSSLGAYYVSKSLVGVVLKSIQEEGKNSFDPLELTLEVSGPHVEPDRTKGYCLDFLGSITSHDIIKVDRDKETGLLQRVSSLADDQSVEIAKRLIDIFFFGATHLQKPGGGRAITHFPTKQQVKARYDPTDPVQAAILNDRLNDFGFCLILEGQPPIDRRARSQYCEDPSGFIAVMGLDEADLPAQQVRTKISNANGLLYRPRRPYMYYLLRKENRHDPSSWRPRESKIIDLENLSPVLAIGVNRSFFTRRRAELTFDSGVLRNVKIDKNSELAGFVEIPVYLANTIVAIPGTIARLRIDNTEANAKLVAMQLRLIEKRIDVQKVINATTEIQEENLTPGT